MAQRGAAVHGVGAGTYVEYTRYRTVVRYIQLVAPTKAIQQFHYSQVTLYATRLASTLIILLVDLLYVGSTVLFTYGSKVPFTYERNLIVIRNLVVSQSTQ